MAKENALATNDWSSATLLGWTYELRNSWLGQATYLGTTPSDQVVDVPPDTLPVPLIAAAVQITRESPD